MTAYDLAIADHNKAIELRPEYALAYLERCIAYALKRLNDKAIADCRASLKLDPNLLGARARKFLNILGAAP